MSVAFIPKTPLFHTSKKRLLKLLNVPITNIFKIIEGNPDKIKFVTDNWKFTRNIKQKDPNWYLSEIISK